MEDWRGDFDVGEFLVHFNPNHDPRNGQFTESPNGHITASKTSDNSKSSSDSSSNASSQANGSKTQSTSNNKIEREKLKKILKVGGIAVGSALVVLGSRYIISQTVDTYAKKHIDKVLRAETVLSTLSFDPERTTGTDMFYATYEKKDKSLYGALFNMPINELKNSEGKVIGKGVFLKQKIENIVNSPIRVASEDSGVKIFENLCRNDSKFSEFVLSETGMQARFVEDKYKFKGYREARAALERIRASDNPSSHDYKTVYRMFNYVIPNTDDLTKTQRAKFFSALLDAGYGAVLDTNDAIYGGFKAKAPVIVFDMTQVVPSKIIQTTMKDKKIEKYKTIANRVFGLNL